MSVTNPEGVKKYFVAAFPRYEEFFLYFNLASLIDDQIINVTLCYYN